MLSAKYSSTLQEVLEYFAEGIAAASAWAGEGKRSGVRGIAGYGMPCAAFRDVFSFQGTCSGMPRI